MRNKNLKIFIVLAAVAAILPVFVLAETLNSTNYSIENPEFDAGSGPSNSTNYASRDAIGAEGDSGSSSTNYKGFWGFVLPAYPGVPGAPTLTNTGGTLYNSLDFVINNGNDSTDTNFAIAISSDNFVTTRYVQLDDTTGTSPAWQTYTAWGGGTGQRITGLSVNTTYKIKVKARYGPDSETAYSLTATAATVAPQLTVSIAGVNLGTQLEVGGDTTTITTTASAIHFSTLPVGSAVVAAQTITVSTNATGGYTTTLAQDGDLRNNAGNSIAAVSASNASPAAWPGSVTIGAFGYHTTDGNLCTGTPGRFTSNKYAAATTTQTEVICNNTAVSNESNSIVYKLQIGSLQQAGTYQNIITYITTAIF